MIPEPTGKTHLRRLYAQIAEHYPEEELVYATLSGMLRRRFVRRVLRGMRGPLLDVGCNRGVYAASYRHGRVCGIDIAMPALRHARNRCPAAWLVRGDAENLYFLRPQSFRNVLATEVVEHLLDPESCVRGMARALGEGLLLVTTPNYRTVRPVVGRFHRYREFGIEEDSLPHTAYKPEELRRMLEPVGGLHVVAAGTVARETRVCQKLAHWVLRLLPWRTDVQSTEGHRRFHRIVIYVYRALQWTCLLPLVRLFETDGEFSYAIARRQPEGSET